MLESLLFESLFKEAIDRKSNPTYKKDLELIYEKYLHKTLGRKEINTISNKHIDTILKKINHLSLSRKQKILGIVIQVFNEAVENELITRSPILTRQRIKVDKEAQKFVIKEAKEMFTVLVDYFKSKEENSVLKVMGFMLLEQGRRKNEIYQMRWGDINFKEIYCDLPLENSKNKKGFQFQLSKNTLKALRELFQDNTLYGLEPRSEDFVLGYRRSHHICSFDYEYKKLKSKMIEYFESINRDDIVKLLVNYSPHRYRNLFATYHYNETKAKQSDISLALGHINEQQAEQYITPYAINVVGGFVN